MTTFSSKPTIKLLFFSLFILLGTQSNLPALAEEVDNVEEDLTEISSQEEAPIKEAKVVSRVGFMDPKITSQEKNLFWLDFAIENPGPPESDISYGVQLTKETDKGSVLVDEFFFNEKVSVSPEQSINRRVAYLAPEFLTGDFQLWLLAKQSAGQPRGIAFLGDVSLTGTDQYIELKAETCFLSIEGEDKKYSPSEGVSFRPEEKILLNCRAENKTGKDINVFGSFVIFERNVSTGEKTEVTEKTPWKDHFSVGEGKDLAIELPIPPNPQAYDIQVSLRDESRFVSNSITAHYVLAGESATIANILFDKTNYQLGEKVNLTIAWTGSAHNFLNSRVNPEAENQRTETLKVKAVLKDSNGLPCSEEISKNQLNNDREEKVALTLNNECSGMKAVVTLLGESEKILDQKEASFKREELVSDNKSPYAKTFLILVIIISLILIALLFVYFKLRKKTGPLTLFLLIGISFFGFSNNAHAETKTLIIYLADSSCSGDVGWNMTDSDPLTWSDSKKSCTRNNVPYCVDYNGYCSTTDGEATAGVSTNKSEYAPGEKVTVSATGTLIAACNNPIDSVVKAKPSWLGSYSTVYSKSVSSEGSFSTSGHVDFIAPAEAGDYTISISLSYTHPPFYFLESSSLKIKVVGGATPPPATPPTNYSCVGDAPDGITELYCPDPGTELTYNKSWVNVGSSASNCNNQKCEYYVPIVSNTLPTAGGCGGFLPSSSCTKNSHTLSSSASPWYRSSSISGDLNYSCSAITKKCTAKQCVSSSSITNVFSRINFSSTASGPADTILSWSCSAYQANCSVGDSHYQTWCSAYTPSTGTPSCTASSNVSAFSAFADKKIENMPVSVSGGDWYYCDSACGTPSSSVSDTNMASPLPACDARRRVGISACNWSNRSNCSTQKEIFYQVTNGEKTFRCGSVDIDAPDYDTIKYSFKLMELGGAAEVNCIPNVWREVSGGWCRQKSVNSDELVFRSSDPRARYKLTCTADDQVGSKDYGETIVEVGEAADISCALYPERIAVCAGESTTVRVETHPDNASVNWSCTNGQSGSNNADFDLNFTNASAGSKQISMTATSGALTTNCYSSVNVLTSSCDVNLDPVGATDLGALVPGSKVQIIADPSCFTVASGNAYKFILTKDGGNAEKGVDYKDVPPSVTGGYQAVDNVTIEIINPGQYGVNLTIIKSDGGNVSCNNEFLANTPAPEWWERRP